MAEGEPKKVLIKVVDSVRSRKFGLCVSTLEDLVQKCRNAFQISGEGNVKVVLDGDETQIVDDLYLQCLEPQTVLMVLIDIQMWEPEQSGSGNNTDPERSGQMELNELIEKLKKSKEKAEGENPFGKVKLRMDAL